MSRLKLGIATVAFLALPIFGSAQTDVTGTWIVSVSTPQGKLDFETTIKQAGEKVTGVLNSPMGSADFVGTLVKDDLAINYSASVQGQTIEIKMTGLVQGETISGMIDLGGLMQAEWNAKRKPAESVTSGGAAAAPVTGTPPAGGPGSVSGKWNISVQMGPNPLAMTGVLSQNGEAVTGTISTPLGDLPVTGTMIGTTLNLEFTAQMPQGEMRVTMNGQLGASGLSGKSSIAGLGESDWSATRAE